MEKTTITATNANNSHFLFKTRRLFVKMLNSLTKRTTIVEVISALLIILFIYTGLNKIMDYNTFLLQVGRSPFLEKYNKLIAITLPPSELFIALSLVFKRSRLLGLHLSFFLMTLFTGYVWVMLNYAYDLPCSCGGIISSMDWHDHLIFNFCFTILALVAIFLESNSKMKSIKIGI